MKSAQGFSLLELMVAIAIIALLTSIILPNIMGNKAKSRDVIRIGDLKSLSQAAEAYQMEGQNQYMFPLRITDLEPYFRDNKLPKDPMTGENYFYYFKSGDSPRIYCFGAIMETENMQNEETCNFSDPALEESNPAGTPNYVVKGP